MTDYPPWQDGVLNHFSQLPRVELDSVYSLPGRCPRPGQPELRWCWHHHPGTQQLITGPFHLSDSYLVCIHALDGGGLQLAWQREWNGCMYAPHNC
jgi:hypothetical protein